MGTVYPPGEDSYFLQEYVEKLVSGEVLDMGTGSGVQAVSAASKDEVTRVVAVDINPQALEVARKRALEAQVLQKITFVQSDLFEGIEGYFDWIIFNPPYLPTEGELEDPTWAGGERGAELIERFLAAACSHLKTGGKILLIYSSETLFKADKLGYKWSILGEKKLFFETLYCVLLIPT